MWNGRTSTKDKHKYKRKIVELYSSFFCAMATHSAKVSAHSTSRDGDPSVQPPKLEQKRTVRLGRMDVHPRYAGPITDDMRQYGSVCQWKCSLTREGKLSSPTRTLVPPPPLSLVPQYWLDLFQQHIGDDPAKPLLLTARQRAPDGLTVHQQRMMRFYGLIRKQRLSRTAAPSQPDTTAGHKRKAEATHDLLLKKARSISQQPDTSSTPCSEPSSLAPGV